MDGTLLIALGKIGDKEEIVVPLLVEALKNPKRITVAAVGLGHMGPKAKAGVPALIESLDVCVKMEPEAAWTAVGIVLHALEDIGPDARSAIPTLKKMSTDKRLDNVIRGLTRRTLEKLDR